MISPAEARRAARNAGAIAAASVISKGVLFVWYIVLARALGETHYGIYGTVSSFIAVGTAIVNFGMGPIVIRDVARNPAQAGKYLTATLIMQSLLAVAAYALVNSAALLGGYPADIQYYLTIASISLLVDILGNMTNDVLLAQERMLASSLVAICHIFILIGLAALALTLNYGLLGVYIATLLAGLIRSSLLWALVLRGGVRLQRLDRSIARPLLVNGAPLAASAFLSLAYQHADKLMTTRLIDTTQTGYLTAAFVVIFGVIELLNTTILTATYPMMSRYHGEGETFGFIVEKLAFFTLVISLPIALVLSLFASHIIIPLFGANYSPTVTVLRILIWYATAAMVTNVFAQALVTQNRQRRLLVVRAIGLGSNIIMNILLIIPLGISGAAVASLLAEILVLTVLLYGFHAPGWEQRRILTHWLRLGGVALVVAAVMLAAGQVHFLLGIVAGAVVYAFGLARVLTPTDWDLLYRLLAAMPGGTFILRYWKRDVAVNW
ncbi:MAG: flippase [Anaerolineae bacterium]|nr:flippase [Anaerolineae bacterium]